MMGMVESKSISRAYRQLLPMINKIHIQPSILDWIAATDKYLEESFNTSPADREASWGIFQQVWRPRTLRVRGGSLHFIACSTCPFHRRAHLFFEVICISASPKSCSRELELHSLAR